jgi:4-aminobutyrate aminotransferase/(S)-3-amino-2-methylpropionate transaminase
MGSDDQLIARRRAVTPRGIPLTEHSTIRSARGATLTDVTGREIIDFASGIGVMNVGHCNPKVVDAIREQAERLLHAGIHVSTYEPYVALCEKLVSLFPHGRSTKAMLTNSGAESVENAIKIARQATGRPAIVCFSESFHGRTMMAMSLTSKVGYKQGCGPFAPEIYRLPFPNHFRYGDGLSEAAFVHRELHRLREAFVTTVSADQVAAVILEPIQGEGGFVSAPVEYLRGLRALCDEFGILLILDEVQSGFGRTGYWAAYEHYNVVPDLSTWAKSMGGGMPIGCVIGKAEIMDSALPGTIGGTYGGNPVACAASLAAIQEIEDQGLCQRATLIGQQVLAKFGELQRQYPAAIGDVRGLGAMVAMEFVADRDPLKPLPQIVAQIARNCIDHGLLILSAGPYANCIRFLAPLVITDAELQRGLDILATQIGQALQPQLVAAK